METAVDNTQSQAGNWKQATRSRQLETEQILCVSEIVISALQNKHMYHKPGAHCCPLILLCFRSKERVELSCNIRTTWTHVLWTQPNASFAARHIIFGGLHDFGAAYLWVASAKVSILSAMQPDTSFLKACMSLERSCSSCCWNKSFTMTSSLLCSSCRFACLTPASK